MHIKDYATAQGWFRKHAAAPSSVGSWKAFVARNKRAQEPRTMAQEPRNMYSQGQLVQNTVDGSRPGYQGKNQFTGNNPLNIKQSTYDLIPQIKEDAKTMSEKEIKEKYKIHKKTLKKIKDAENIKFRTTYLPEGTQKKSIPYAERYTATEKSEMYKKVKAKETEEDRIKARERKAKSRDKIYKEYKMEPSSRGFKDDLWKDITRSSKEGNRIKLIEGPKYASGTTYDKFKSRRFLDTLTNTEFGYNDLEKYLDSGKLKNVTYESVSNPYKLKWEINKSGLREEIQKAYFGEKYQPPKMFRAQNTFHVHHVGGVAADPFTTQLTFADQNLGLVHNKKFNENWAKLIEKNAPLSERKAYLKFIKSKIGPNIAQTLEFPEVGKTRTYGEIGTNMQKLLSDEKLKTVKGLPELKTFLKEAGFNIDKCLSSGGRVNLKLGKGVNTCIAGVVDKELALARKSGNTAKFTKFGKLARGAGYLFGWVDIPIELAFALPHLFAGDVQGAKRATTAGFFGYGGKRLEGIDPEKNPEAYKYFKHVEDLNNWMDAFNQQQNADTKLREVPEDYGETYKKHGDKSGYIDFHLKQYNDAVATQENIAENYIGYVNEEGEEDLRLLDLGKEEGKKYLRETVKKEWKEGMPIRREPFSDEPYHFTPYKEDKITSLEQQIKQKGESFYGGFMKPGVKHRAEELGAPDLYDDWYDAFYGKDPRDAHSSLPLEWTDQLAELEKKELYQSLADKLMRPGGAELKKSLIEQGFDFEPFREYNLQTTGGWMSEGGIASLMKKK
jgi:hypothetical protein